MTTHSEARPWRTYTVTATPQPDQDLLEHFCAENEKDVQHFR